ncbi:sulfatase-like hydrolase/transferase [Tunicatimonas pelagia]|uniref:sulfatase-like hydrolase/transferase n=1 Tax=Tunicatimonas pelagia TaxID=931531 RepID=UPI002664F837|nr:sulfatase-like hydrolase/transferase [Tunicatimonas pelagia]WKN40510.1 sulfatase-like hydrolase/transferase [Tunicatimonas pelagia]
MTNPFAFSVKLILSTLLILFALTGYSQQPNVVLIMADDMGYECLSTYGSTSYQTPVLDSLAASGIQFAHCISQPLCTPSRVKIMTGLYNYRNYEYFGYLNENQYTFGNLMREAGYQTCIAGKWQLNGLAYTDEISSWNDDTRPKQFGFDEYCLWQLTKGRGEGERFANPLIEQNGKVLERNEDDYGPDIFADYILDFIERKKDQPFFVYYPMVLVHEPFVPTPDSEEWADKDRRYENDTAYFKDMVAYADKIVGRIADKLQKSGLDENTLLIFTGDNGTHPSVTSHTKQGTVQGAKGNTTSAGTHVPLIAYWPAMISEGRQHPGLVEFSDFFPTLAHLVDKPIQSDGKSLYSLLTNTDYQSRETAFVHYDPRWGNNVNQYRDQFVQTVDYKLYQDGRFFNIANDLLEKNPLNEASLTQTERKIHTRLVQEMKNHPDWKPAE